MFVSESGTAICKRVKDDIESEIWWIYFLISDNFRCEILLHIMCSYMLVLYAALRCYDIILQSSAGRDERFKLKHSICLGFLFDEGRCVSSAS